MLLLLATNTIPLDSRIIQRAKELEAVGSAFDALRVRDTEVEEPRCARQSRERKRAVAGTSSEIAGCDPTPPLSYVRGSA